MIFLQVLYENGIILTMEQAAQAQALLIEDGVIRAVGTQEEVKAAACQQAVRVDLHGAALLPGFIDAHSHFSGYAMSFLQASVEEAVSFDEITAAIQQFICARNIPAGQWVVVNGLDQTRLEEQQIPDRRVLDRASQEHPVVLVHQSGHTGVFNSLALDKLGITVKTASPKGGRIEQKGGRLTGYMEEEAFVAFLKQVPMPSMQELLNAYQKAQRRYASFGITTIQEGLLAEQLIPLYQTLLSSGLLQLDLVAYVDIESCSGILRQFQGHIKHKRNHLKIGGYKTFLDGSPQARTAWVRAPYQSNSGNRPYYGYGTLTNQRLAEQMKKAAVSKTQLLAHCNGDAACQQYLTVLEETERMFPQFSDLRPVMIHAQLLGEDQLPAVKRLGVIPSFFVGHVYHWGDIHRKNFGEQRAAGLSPAKQALEHGVLFTFHQDSPVIEPDMMETVWCAVNRRTKSGVKLGDGIPVEEALKAVTIHAAYQYFEEDQKGSLKPGKLADLVILDQNPLTVDPMSLRDIKVLETIKEGKTIYRAE